jgi:hypothetical protein
VFDLGEGLTSSRKATEAPTSSPANQFETRRFPCRQSRGADREPAAPGSRP